MRIRKSKERGHANRGWLDSFHSFSFASYFDQNWMGFSVLRVINEDKIMPGKGFGTHAHQDMEIITYVIEGELAHQDSLGNTQVLRAGEVQRMTAGSGIEHSEFNASDSNPLHLIQIWIEPNQFDLTPAYEDKIFTDAQKNNQWCLLASEDTFQGSLKIHQNMALYAAKLSERKQLDYALKKGRCAYLHVVQGTAQINGKRLATGDAALFDDAASINIKVSYAAELLLFDLPIKKE
ncbi:MAG: pirin family protein [Methylophilaceae bacterium]